MIFAILFVIANEIKNEKSLKKLKIEYIFIYSEQSVALWNVFCHKQSLRVYSFSFYLVQTADTQYEHNKSILAIYHAIQNVFVNRNTHTLKIKKKQQFQNQYSIAISPKIG